MSYHHAKHFTLEEASDLLPTIVPMLEELRDLKLKLDELGYDVRGHHFISGMGTNGTTPYPSQMDALIELFKKVTAKGIQVKGMESGLIDFPCIRSDGQEVYLCYRLGEPTIQYWHTIEDGFAGRKSVDSL